MKVIPPIAITSALLTSSTAAEPGPGETAWNSTTNYTVGQRAIRATTHRVYEAVVAGVDSGLPENTPARWLDVGPTNRYAMFDLARNSATAAAGTLTVVIAPGKRINAIALIGLVAEHVDITMTVGATTVYSYSQNLATRDTSGWTDYFFGEFGSLPTVIRFDLPPYASAVLTVTLTSATGIVQCGALCIGSAVDLGRVQANPRSDALNFSRIDRDSFGNATLVPRRTVPKTTQTLLVEKQRVNRLLDVREALNAVPAVWSGLDDVAGGYFDALLILGIYKQFSIDMSYDAHAVATLELEEI